MDADFEERTAGRLRAEVAEVVPDDLTPPPLPELEVPYQDDDPDEEVVRIRVHTPLWPFAVAAAVAVIAVGVTIGVRPDQTATTASPATSTTETSAAPPASLTASPVPNVFWVPMPDDASSRAENLLAAWDDHGTAPEPPRGVVDGMRIESARLDDSGSLEVSVVGGELGTGPCQQQVYVSVRESATAVAVLLTPHNASTEAIECPAIGYALTIPVELAEPLGQRDLLALNRWNQVNEGPVAVPVTR